MHRILYGCMYVCMSVTQCSGFGRKGDGLCVCNQSACAVNCAEAVDRLLI